MKLLTKPIILLKEVESEICKLLKEKDIDEAVKVIINYLARHRVIIYEEKPKIVIYAFDIDQRPVMALLFSNFAISIKESHIYINPITIVKFPFED